MFLITASFLWQIVLHPLLLLNATLCAGCEAFRLAPAFTCVLLLTPSAWHRISVVLGVCVLSSGVYVSMSASMLQLLLSMHADLWLNMLKFL
jgi:uncharacterized membrane protein